MPRVKYFIISLVMLCIECAFCQSVDIEGAIRIENSTAAVPDTGTIQFNSTTMDFEGFDGTSWRSLTGAAGTTGLPTDLDGNEYKIVTIGTQVWMRENLRTTKYSTGTSIPEVNLNADWENLSTGAWCWNANNHTFEIPYGKLYNWHAVSNSEGLCPMGWHVPTDVEMTELITFLDTGFVDSTAFWQGTVAGFKMNEAGTAHWNAPNADATNESGLTLLPGGIRYPHGPFNTMGANGHFWSSTASDSTKAFVRCTYFDDGRVLRGAVDKRIGYSIRCLKD